MSNYHLVPENVKGIALAAQPNNVHTNMNEKMNALTRLQEIRNYCQHAIEQVEKANRKFK